MSVTAGLALGLGLGAIQWLPGLATISSSQRGVDSMALYSSGSLPVRWVLLTLVPDLLGGSGSLGAASDVSKVELPDPDAVHDAVAGIRIGLTAPGGSTRWFRAHAVTSSTLAITVAGPVTSVAVVAQAHEAPGVLGPPSVVAADGSVVVADGQLQGALIPPRWQFAGFDGRPAWPSA